MMESLQIQQLKIRYRESFKAKSIEINTHLQALSDLSCQVQPQLTDTRELLHKLAGSSGMYGYQDIAAVARDAMQDTQQESIPVLLEKLTYLRKLLDQYSQSGI